MSVTAEIQAKHAKYVQKGRLPPREPWASNAEYRTMVITYFRGGRLA
jgi:hypothetical protein